MKRWYWVVVMMVVAWTGHAETVYPRPGWREAPNPIASADAVSGGRIRVFIGQAPKSFNYFLESSYSTVQIFSLMYDTLLYTDPITLDYAPGLVSEWRISDDRKRFTLRLDPDAKWSDRTPITADDVIWTYAMIVDKRNLIGPQRLQMERFLPPTALPDGRVQFVARDVHWKNLGALGSLRILPKHVYASRDFNTVNGDFTVVSGPYRQGTSKAGVVLNLERNANWWARDKPRYHGMYNFDQIICKFYGERDNAYQDFKKEKMDLFPVYASRRWVNETRSAQFQRNWIVKQAVYNSKPVGFQGFAMNMRRPKFADLRVRMALAHLVHREKMNQELMYNSYFLHRSYYEDLYSAGTPPVNKPVEFDTARARQLLTDAGWRADRNSGMLMRDGQPFVIHFLTRSASSDPFLNIYKEDLRDVGIDLHIERKDWAAWVKDMDEFNFDMTWAAWGAEVRKDPEAMWASTEADRRQGENITGFRSPDVDRLIAQQRTIFDVRERHAIVRTIDQLVFAEHPYALLWNINYTRLLYWNRFGMPTSVLSKYDGEAAALAYWWLDDDSAADLTDAQEQGTTLSKRPLTVRFND